MSRKLLVLLFLAFLTIAPVASNLVFDLQAAGSHYDYVFKNMKQFWQWMEINGYTRKDIVKFRVLPNGHKEIVVNTDDGEVTVEVK